MDEYDFAGDYGPEFEIDESFDAVDDTEIAAWISDSYARDQERNATAYER